MTVFSVNFGVFNLYLTKYSNQWYHFCPEIPGNVFFPERNTN